MKIHIRLVLLFLIALLSLSITHTSFAQTTDSLKTGLIGYWKFDEIDSINLTVSDDSGNNNTGLIGKLSRLLPGKFGQAMMFDDSVATSKLQYMGTGSSFSAKNWSLSAWVNPTLPFATTLPNGGINSIISTDVQLLGIRKDGVYYYTTKIVAFDFVKNPGWHHIVYTYNGTNLTAVVDGKFSNSIPLLNLMEKSAKRYIGVNTPYATNHKFRGLVDDVRLYNRVLTGNEIFQLSTLPQVDFLSSFTIETNKASYAPQETIKMSSTFTIDPAWVTHLISQGETQGEVQFILKDDTNTSLISTTFVFDIKGTSINNNFDFTVPSNPIFMGKALTFEVNVYSASKKVTAKKLVTGINILAPVASPGTNIYTLSVTKNGAGTVGVLLDSAQTLYSHGDSITVGSLATALSKRYVNTIAKAFGLGVANRAVNGSILEETGQIDNIYAQNIDETSISTILTGYNNHRYFGTDTTRLDTYKKALPVALAYLSIPNSKKAFGTSLTTTGTWTATSTYGTTGKSIATKTAGSTATVTMDGSVLYVAGTRVEAANTGSITVYVDDLVMGTYSCSGVKPSSTQKRTYAPFMARLSGLQNGPHTVRIVSNSDGYCQIDWVGGNANLTAFPRVYVGGALLMTPDRYIKNSPAGSVQSNTLYNTVITQTRDMLASDGLNVITAPTETTYNPVTDISSDNVHPNDLGHQRLATTFINSFKEDTYKFKSNTPVRLIAFPTNASSTINWIGCDSKTGNTCKIKMVGNKTPTVEFIAL